MPVKNFVLILMSFLMISPLLKAQTADSTSAGSGSYKLGAGVRLAPDIGLSIKYFMDKNHAVEGLFEGTAKYHGYGLIGLYEIHAEAFHKSGLNWFYGGGAHLNYYEKRNFLTKDNKRLNKTLAVGVDGILGLEYYIQEIPFTIGIDVKPSLDFTPGIDFYPGGGFTIRYVIQ